MYQEYYDNDNYQDDMNYYPVEEYNWSPNLFAKIVSYLNESVSPDVIRLGIIAGIRKSSSAEDAPTNWDKVETMRRYVDSVNRGLGLPEDATLMSLLHSTQWTGYGLFSMSFISEMNLDYQGICMDEQTSLSYPSMVFLIALVKGMSMINLKNPSSTDEAAKTYTYLVPSQFSTFSYASFLNVANHRLFNKEEITPQDIEELTGLAFKGRYWKQGTSLKGKDSELFINVLKSIMSDILGLTLNVDMESFSKQAKQVELIAATPKEVTLTEKELSTQKLSVAKAVEIVLNRCSLPLERDQLLLEIQELRPSTREDTFNTMLSKLHKDDVINFFEGGLIGVKGKRYGRGYKKVDRFKKKKLTI